MLYRLDYIDASGREVGPVKNTTGDDFLSRHMSTARKRAIEAAGERELSVQVTRIGKAGQTRPTLIVRPDGGAEPPRQARSDCKAGPGKPPCFCRNCRAERRR
jgi:hypothetical protein